MWSVSSGRSGVDYATAFAETRKMVERYPPETAIKRTIRQTDNEGLSDNKKLKQLRYQTEATA